MAYSFGKVPARSLSEQKSVCPQMRQKRETVRVASDSSWIIMNWCETQPRACKVQRNFQVKATLKIVEILWISLTINYPTSAFGPKSEGRHSISATSLNTCSREITSATDAWCMCRSHKVLTLLYCSPQIAVQLLVKVLVKAPLDVFGATIKPMQSAADKSTWDSTCLSRPGEH